MRHTGSALKSAVGGLLGSRPVEEGANASESPGAGGLGGRMVRFASQARRGLMGKSVLASVCWTPAGVKVAALRLGSERETLTCDYLEAGDRAPHDGPPSEADAMAAGQKLSQWLAATMGRLDGWLAGVIVVIPRRHVSVRYLTLPSDDINHIDQMVGYQLHRLVPFEKSAAAYSAIPVLRHDDGSSTVMVSVVRREVLDAFVATAEGLPVAAVLVDAEASALAPLRGEPGPADQEREDAPGTFVAERDGGQALLYVRGRAAPVSFSRALALGQDAAEVLPREISTSIRTFASRVPRPQVDRVLLLNWGETAAELTAKLKTALPGLEISDFQEPASTPGLEAVRGRPDAHPGSGLSFRAVLGPLLNIGAWKTDLSPAQSKKALRNRGVRRQLAVSASLAAILLLLLALLSAVRVTAVQGQISRIEKKLAVLEPAAHRAERMERALRDLAGVRQGTDLLDALTELSSLLPPSIQVSSLSYQRGRFLDFAGTAGSLDEVLETARRLEGSTLFSHATVRYANTRSGRQQDVTDFRMVLTAGGGGASRTRVDG